MMFKPSRRMFLAASGASVVAGGVAAAGLGLMQTGVISASPASPMVVTNKQALQTLLAGNLRFQKGQQKWPNQTIAQRLKVTKRQSPFAIIFGCVDSRVPPELVFDQGLGDIFTIRTAGHVLDCAVLGSIELGVAELGVPLIVVLGHEQCGAVCATVHAIDKHEHTHGEIDFIVRQITPSVLAAKGKGDERIENAVQNNIRRTVRSLSDEKTSTVLSKAVKDGKLTIVGCRYDLDTGAVSVLS